MTVAQAKKPATYYWRPTRRTTAQKLQSRRWGGQQQIESLPAQPCKVTMFEQVLKHLGLAEADRSALKASAALRLWVESRFRSRYVPEWLLDAYGIGLRVALEHGDAKPNQFGSQTRR